MTPSGKRKAAMIAAGAWSGVVGGGYLARYFAMAAHGLGYRVMVSDSDRECLAASAADRHLCADYEDSNALRELGTSCAAVTTVVDNVPTSALTELARFCDVRPNAMSASVAHDRTAEKDLLARTVGTGGYAKVCDAIDWRPCLSISSRESSAPRIRTAMAVSKCTSPHPARSSTPLRRIEFCLTRDSRIVVSKITPRPHDEPLQLLQH